MMRLYSIIVLVLLAACSSPSVPTTEQDVVGVTSVTDSLGNTLSLEDLASVSGRFDYSTVGAKGVSDAAKYLHQQARKIGQTGEYDKVINTLKKAHKLAPSWPYPTYDLAYTYLLMDDSELALHYYELTDSLAPNGYFLSKTAIHTLKREQRGDLKKGIYRAFVSLETYKSPKKKFEMLKALTTQIPTFAPGWKDYANLVKGKLRKKAVEAGLSVDIDVETQGVLLINKAIILNGEGKKEEARQVLMHVIFNQESTLGNVEIAKAVLKQLMG